ncbi:hypothetical protein C8R45DRAFT_1204503 [Mycena sanguinolenta]|nr:hypothetical protein C8R45DRAFT_1204503 [Mycena sanguinolenta]
MLYPVLDKFGFASGVLSGSVVVGFVEKGPDSLAAFVAASLSTALIDQVLPALIAVNLVVLNIVLLRPHLHKIVSFMACVKLATPNNIAKFQDTTDSTPEFPVEEAEFIPGGYFGESSIKELTLSSPPVVLVLWMMFVGWSSISCSLAILVVQAFGRVLGRLAEKGILFLESMGRPESHERTDNVSKDETAETDSIDLEADVTLVDDGAKPAIIPTSPSALQPAGKPTSHPLSSSALPFFPASSTRANIDATSGPALSESRGRLNASAAPFVPPSPPRSILNAIMSTANVKKEWQPTRHLSFWTRYPTRITAAWASSALDPSSAEFVPKAREIAFRSTPPSFWSPGRSPVPIVLSSA